MDLIDARQPTGARVMACATGLGEDRESNIELLLHDFYLANTVTECGDAIGEPRDPH